MPQEISSAGASAEVKRHAWKPRTASCLKKKRVVRTLTGTRIHLLYFLFLLLLIVSIRAVININNHLNVRLPPWEKPGSAPDCTEPIQSGAVYMTQFQFQNRGGRCIMSARCICVKMFHMVRICLRFPPYEFANRQTRPVADACLIFRSDKVTSSNTKTVSQKRCLTCFFFLLHHI